MYDLFFITMQYFLKARFGFDKKQFADLLLLITIVGSISQVNILRVIIYINLVFITKYLNNFYTLIDIYCLMLSQLFVLPRFASTIGERKLLSTGLFMEFINVSIFLLMLLLIN